MADDLQQLLYCQEAYAKIHSYHNYQRFPISGGVGCFALEGDHAVSLPKSPVGGFSLLNESKTEFVPWLERIEKKLETMGVHHVEITLPPRYYPNSVPTHLMLQTSFREIANEVTHYIPLVGELSGKIHDMQKRKLKKGQSFDVALQSHDQLEEVHSFISECRAEQGLQINIDYPVLKSLFDVFPARYQVFAARKSGTLAAAAIMVIPISGVAYYFLPATAAAFKHESPMVPLIAEIYRFYLQKGFDYLDLGISSQQGNPQKGLIAFKERMGGIRTSRHTFYKQLGG